MTDEDELEDELKEELKNFDSKSKEEKIQTIRELHGKLDDESADGLIQKLGIDGEVKVRVLDDEGDEKQVEKVEF